MDKRQIDHISNSLSSLTPTTKRYIDRLLNGKLLWMPHVKNNPQVTAYCTEADILYYGGRAGGGKSDLLLGLALTDHRKSIIFRREYKQLRELIDRSTEILGETSARYSEKTSRWRDIPGNRVLEFGAVQLEKHKENYKGRPHDLIGFDEIPDFSESQFRFLMAWNRTTLSNQRCRVVCTGNPPTTPGGRWVINYWAPWLRRDYPNKAVPGELRWFAGIDGIEREVETGKHFTYKKELIIPKSRTFIPASLSDNPYFDNTDYYATLQALPEPLRSQLLKGDFFKAEIPQIRQVIPSEHIRMAQARWRKDDSRAKHSPTVVGVDPSRGGKDKTEFALRVGSYFKPGLSYDGKEVVNGGACVAYLLEEIGHDFTGLVLVDVIGIGSSVYDILDSLEFQVTDVNFAAASQATDKTGKLKMRNVRAEAYWALREALDPEDGIGLALPPDEEIFQDLTAVKWTRTAQGILLDSKKTIRKTLGRSPGKGDAIALAMLDVAQGVFFR